jgi:hypothetical protein
MHHVLSLGAVLVRYFTGKVMVIGLSALVAMEVTNPSLHGIWCLREVGLGESKLFLYNAYLFVAIYFIFRIVGCGYLLYFFASGLHSKGLLYGPLATSVVVFGALTALSYFWFSKIVKLMLRAKERVEGGAAKDSKKSKKSQ